MELEYSKWKCLKKDDVESLIDWTRKHPNLPEITGEIKLLKISKKIKEKFGRKQKKTIFLSEKQAMNFLHSCYYDQTRAQKTIENYFATKIKWPEFFQNRRLDDIKKILETT